MRNNIFLQIYFLFSGIFSNIPDSPAQIHNFPLIFENSSNLKILETGATRHLQPIQATKTAKNEKC